MADLHQDINRVSSVLAGAIMGNFLEGNCSIKLNEKSSKKSSQSFKKLSTFFREKIRLRDLEWRSVFNEVVYNFVDYFFKIWQAQKKYYFDTVWNSSKL